VAWSSSPAPTYNDAPTFVAKNLIEGSSPDDAKWTDTGHQDATGGNVFNDTDFPTKYAFDRFGHKVTKPSGALAQLWYYNVTVTDLDEAGGILILNHNLGSFGGGGVRVKVQTADVDDYGDSQGPGNEENAPANRRTIHDFGNVTDNKRLVALPSTVYSNLERIRIELSHASVNFRPQIGEFHVGPVNNITHGPRTPYDPDRQHTEVSELVSKSGIITSYARYSQQSILDIRVQLDKDADVTAIQDTYEDTDGGNKACLLLTKPVSDLKLAYWVKIPNDLNIPSVGPAERLLTFPCRELAPFRRKES